MSNYELNESGESSVITVDPDRYSRDPERATFGHDLLKGNRSETLRALHYVLTNGWDFLEETPYEALRALFYKNLLLYFDDSDVPPLVETKIIYDTASYDYTGITNPSSTHKAYYDNSASLPSAEGDFETTEFSTASYQAIDADDSNIVESACPTADHYYYWKFLIESGIAQGNVQRIRFRVVAYGDDQGNRDKDGLILYGWNQTAWQEVDRCSSSAKKSLSYSTAVVAVAQTFVDAADGYVRLLLRTQGTREGANYLYSGVYYVEVEVNEGLSMVVSLSHTPVLSAGDVVWVKNLTDSTTLVLTTDYTISGSDVTVIGEDAGDQIECKYNRDFEGYIREITEEWLAGDPSSDRNRRLEMVFETLSESVVGS